MKIAERLGKDKAHELVYNIATRTSAYQEDFLENLKNDPYISEHFSEEELRTYIDPTNYTGLSAELAQDMSDSANNFIKKLKD